MHPKKLGRWWLGQQPMVHAGFLKAWQYQTYEADQMCVLTKGKRSCSKGPVGEPLDQRIIARVMWLLDNLTPGPGRCRKLLITGKASEELYSKHAPPPPPPPHSS